MEATDGTWVYCECGLDAAERWKAFCALDQRRLEEATQQLGDADGEQELEEEMVPEGRGPPLDGGERKRHGSFAPESHGLSHGSCKDVAGVCALVLLVIAGYELLIHQLLSTY